MSGALTRATNLACWKDLGDVQISPATDVKDSLGLGEGRTNQNFVATTGTGERYFVRIGSDLPPWGVTRAKEQAAARAVATTVGPPLLYAELPDALVCKLVPGRSLTEPQVKAAAGGQDDELLKELAQTIRRLHATPVPPEMAALVPQGAQPRWAPPDLARWIAYAREGGFGRLPLLEDADQVVAEMEATAGALTGESGCFCHFDLLPDNFVLFRGEDSRPSITVVDFEYCNVGQPLMDLAIASMGCNLSEEEERSLVAEYLQVARPLDGATALRFLALKVLATMRETLWGVVAEVSGSSALSPAEAAAYTDSNYKLYLESKAKFEKNQQALQG
jgi:aminoglycoside phosphotransferase (APT) family kinase protein